jgi:hypothetical protein
LVNSHDGRTLGAAASHELRTPFNATHLGIHGLIRRAKGGTLGALPVDAQLRVLGRCEPQARRLASLVDRLLLGEPASSSHALAVISRHCSSAVSQREDEDGGRDPERMRCVAREASGLVARGPEEQHPNPASDARAGWPG